MVLYEKIDKGGLYSFCEKIRKIGLYPRYDKKGTLGEEG